MDLPEYVSVVFIVTTLATLYFLYKASKNSKLLLLICSLWILIQGAIAYTGFYTVINTVPPRFALLILPAFVLIAFLFNTVRGKSFLDSFDQQWLTYLHVVRIPVEMVLYWLFIAEYVPELMTFEGRNLDILSGLSAPIIAYMTFNKNLNRKIILFWNFICLGLLFNIVINAILAAPSAFQVQAFDQPNVGVFYFPFVWLPCFIVPVVLLSHLVCIRQIIKK
ncbi:MAG: hypothetical protein NT150_11395 [Bacteroidetes bacterium]|nr:hypothetical protein [Bacteroidota bacterium]